MTKSKSVTLAPVAKTESKAMAEVKPTSKLVPFDWKAFPVITGAAKIEAFIKATAKSYGSLKPKLHQGLYSALYHASETNDTTLVTRFWNAFGGEINKREGIARWLNAHSNLQYRKAKDGSMQWLKPKKESSTIIKDENGARNVPFYDMAGVKGRNDSVPFSLTDSLERLLARAENKMSDNKLSEYEAKELVAMNKAYQSFLKANPKPVEVVSAVAGTPEASEEVTLAEAQAA